MHTRQIEKGRRLAQANRVKGYVDVQATALISPGSYECSVAI